MSPFYLALADGRGQERFRSGRGPGVPHRHPLIEMTVGKNKTFYLA